MRVVPVIPVPVDVAAFLPRVPRRLRLQHPHLYRRRLHVVADRGPQERPEPGVGDHLHAGVVLLEEMEGVDVEVLPRVKGAGSVVLAVFRNPLTLRSARFPVEAGNGLRPVEGGLHAGGAPRPAARLR